MPGVAGPRFSSDPVFRARQVHHRQEISRAAARTRSQSVRPTAGHGRPPARPGKHQAIRRAHELSDGRQAGTSPKTARPWTSVESRRCTPTALGARTPVRYVSVDTAKRRPAALQDDTRRDREERPVSRKNSQPAGRFRRWWQVLGSNQRRLSRRFYSPLLQGEADAADQRLCASRRVFGVSPSAMRPWLPGRVGAESTDGHGRRDRSGLRTVTGAVCGPFFSACGC